MDNTLLTFLKQILAEAHPAALPQPLLNKMLADLVIQFENQAHDAILGQLSAADQLAYQQQVLDQVSPNELLPWLEQHIPDVSGLLSQELLQLKADYLAVCQK